MDGGPAVRGGGSGGTGGGGGDLHEGRDTAVQPGEREAGEGDEGSPAEPVPDAVLVLRREHVRGRAAGAAGAAGAGGHGRPAAAREGDAEEHAQLPDRRLRRQGRVPVVLILRGERKDGVVSRIPEKKQGERERERDGMEGMRI